MNALIHVRGFSTQGIRKILLTPGPLNCHNLIKSHMMADFGSRDTYFIKKIANIRYKLLKIAKVDNTYSTVLIPGSGTYGVESVLSSIPKEAKLAIFSNGAYGKRMVDIAEINNLNYIHVEGKNDKIVSPDLVKETLDTNSDVTHVSVIHNETTTGILNPIHDIGSTINQVNGDIRYIVDAMSSFGGIPIDMVGANIDYLISSSNKCIESVPISYVIAKRDALEETEGHERSLSLALYRQWINLENQLQFRFTPPTHAVVAFDHALNILIAEGGVSTRNSRYKMYNDILRKRMNKLGFDSYLTYNQGCIISTFKYPSNFNFNKFYSLLEKRNVIIYPGKLSGENTFRLGNIGNITLTDLNYALDTIESVYNIMLHK